MINAELWTRLLQEKRRNEDAVDLVPRKRRAVCDCTRLWWDYVVMFASRLWCLCIAIVTRSGKSWLERREKKEKENGNGAHKKDVRYISLPYSAIPLDSLKGDRRVVLQTYCPFDLRQLTVTVIQKLYSYTEVLDTALIIIMLKILMRMRNITMWDKNRGKIRLIMIMFG